MALLLEASPPGKNPWSSCDIHSRNSKFCNRALSSSIPDCLFKILDNNMPVRREYWNGSMGNRTFGSLRLTTEWKAIAGIPIPVSVGSRALALCFALNITVWLPAFKEHAENGWRCEPLNCIAERKLIFYCNRTGVQLTSDMCHA